MPGCRIKHFLCLKYHLHEWRFKIWLRPWLKVKFHMCRKNANEENPLFSLIYMWNGTFEPGLSLLSLRRKLKHQTFLEPRTSTGSIFAAWQPLRMSKRSWAAVTDFNTRVLTLKPEVQILCSSKSFRHTKVESPRLKSCFLVRDKQNLTQIFERHFQLNYSVGVRDGFTLFCLMICICRANRVTDPVRRSHAVRESRTSGA